MAYTKNPNLPKVRWEAIRLVRSGWSTRKVARHLGYSQSAVAKWVTRAGPSWHGPLPTRSSKPHKSPRALPQEIVSAIITKRVGRGRCGQVVHREMQNDGVSVSLSSVQRTLGRLRLLKKRSPWKRPHDSTERPAATHPGALLQCDTVHIMLPDGSRLYVYTLIDLYSRWAYAEVVPKIGSEVSFAFIEGAAAAAPFAFEMIQTDNGPEFQKMFLFRLAKRGVALRHSRVRKSNDNAHIERFNRTVQEECLDHTPHTFKDFHHALAEYLPYYNGERLHMGIDFKTPVQMLGVSPRC